MRIKSKQIHELTDALLLCTFFKDKDTRDIIVNNLIDIFASIKRSTIPYTDVFVIIETLKGHPRGIESLLIEVNQFERDSEPFKKVCLTFLEIHGFAFNLPKLALIDLLKLILKINIDNDTLLDIAKRAQQHLINNFANTCIEQLPDSLYLIDFIPI